MALHGVKARAYGAIGEGEACRRHIDLAEQAFSSAHDVSGWVGRLRHPAHLAAMTGHAMAELAHSTGAGADPREAHERLTRAVDTYDAATHNRALALCTTRLAMLHLRADDPEQAVHWARRALESTTNVYSARLFRDLATIRALAADRDAPILQELVTDIDALTGSDE
jgi:hypothetical protein